MPKGRKSAGGGAADMDFVAGDDDDEDPTAMLPQSPGPKVGAAKFNLSAEREDGTWQPSGELRKKKGGKNWKKRWCHLEGTRFWYGADKRYLEHGGRGAKWFEVQGAELKDVDEMTFTIVPSSGPNAGEDMIFETLEMNSKRLPDWVKAIKLILRIPISDSDDD